MFPGEISYVRADTPAHAIGLLADGGGAAVAMAGGQSLIPLLKLRLSMPEVVVDIGRLTDWATVSSTAATLDLGSVVTHAEAIAALDRLGGPVVLRDALASIGDRQVRAWGTIGGALGEADPAGDLGPALLALDAEAVITHASGADTVVAVRDFFTGPYATCLGEGASLVSRLRVPVPEAPSAYVKLERKAGSYAMASIAAVADVREGEIVACAVAAGGLADRPVRLDMAEAALTGRPLERAVVDAAAEAAQDQIAPIADARGSADFKRGLLAPALWRALQRAAVR